MAAFPVGHLGDRTSKVRVLAFGYAIGVVTNLLLAFFSHSLPWLVLAILLSGFYIAVEETLEKAVVVGMLPKELRSRGLGVLACVNAVGDMVSSIYVGSLVRVGRPGLAFGLAAFVGALGTPWLFTSSRTRNEKTLNQHPAPSRARDLHVPDLSLLSFLPGVHGHLCGRCLVLDSRKTGMARSPVDGRFASSHPLSAKVRRPVTVNRSAFLQAFARFRTTGRRSGGHYCRADPVTQMHRSRGEHLQLFTFFSLSVPSGSIERW